MTVKTLKTNFLAMLCALSTNYNNHHKPFLKIKDINLIGSWKKCGGNAQNRLFSFRAVAAHFKSGAVAQNLPPESGGTLAMP